MSKRILFVDDEQRELDALCRMLRAQRVGWGIEEAIDAPTAWERLGRGGIDLVVSDISMPGMSGLELLERIRTTETVQNIPVVMISGKENRDLKRLALDLGAADLLRKPIDPEELLARLRNVLRMKDYEDQLRIRNDDLEHKVRLRNRELHRSRMEIVWRLGKVAEHHDADTGDHVARVGCASRIIAEALGCDRPFVEAIFMAAPLHDIGKVGIPDAILLKPGTLTAEEWAVMKQHCAIGAQILREDARPKTLFEEWMRAAQGLPDAKGDHPPELETAARIALMHHEKWDGTGYPQGLVGDEIALEARIVAIADVFDALTSRRPYKLPYAPDDALRIINQGAGSQFDPRVHAAFCRSFSLIAKVREQFSNEDGVLQPRAEADCVADTVR